MSLKRIGPHIQAYTEAAKAWTQICPIVKAVDFPTPFYDAPGNAVRIFRAYFEPGQQTPDVDPNWVVETIINRLAGYRHPNLYVQIFNEAMEMGWELGRHADLMGVIIPNLHAAGVKVAGVGWSMGGYNQAEWDYMRSRNWCSMDAISINAYTVPGNRDYALRYREFWRPGDPPIIITEFNTLNGWKADGLGEQQMFDLLKWYDGEISKDAYVLGAVGFTLASDAYGWNNFELAPIVPLILADNIMDTNPQIENENKDKKEDKLMAELHFGFRDLYDSYPIIVGEPTSEQIDIPGVCSIQFTEHGILVYREGAGVKFLEQTFPLA